MKHARIRKLLFEDNGKNAVILLMITRLVPIFPFNLQNFAYGITDIKFWQFAIFSFIFMLPGTILFVAAAVGLGNIGIL